jgi:aromatic amino acid aminotransferase I / 2-aminoadipate transaminase
VTDTTGVTIPDPTKLPLRSNEIYSRRKQAGKGQWGTAAPSHSNSFRTGSQDGKPFAKRWDSKLTLLLLPVLGGRGHHGMES